MSEAQHAVSLARKLEAALPKRYAVHVGKSLLYKLEVDTSGRLLPPDISNPTRGQYAFQTDVLIEKRTPAIPLVAIELKTDGFSTHDIITYSSKASRHKEIYPYLRYGFLVVGIEALGRKFLTHNQGVDFAMAWLDIESDEEQPIELIQNQIRNAERLVEVMSATRVKFRQYEKRLIIDS